MTAKEKFLSRIQTNIKAAEDKLKKFKEAYAFNKDMPDDFFEGLDVNDDLIGDIGKNGKAVVDSGEYGAQINAVRDILRQAGSEGIERRKIAAKFPLQVEDAYGVVTNAISSLRMKGEIEKFKPKGVTMKGYYWRLKT